MCEGLWGGGCQKKNQELGLEVQERTGLSETLGHTKCSPEEPGVRDKQILCQPNSVSKQEARSFFHLFA